MSKVNERKKGGSLAAKLMLALCFGGLLLGGCSGGVSQQDYDALKSSYEDLNAELESVKNEYASYKESMEEYEDLAAAEAEARRIEAESIAQKEADEKAASEASSIAAEEEEAKAGYDTGITYDQLARNPDDYEGKLVKFSGKVVQLIESSDDDEIQIRLAVNDDYDTILYCGYDKSIVKSRVLEDDEITIYGRFVGLISYDSTLGGNITIPGVYIEKIDQ